MATNKKLSFVIEIELKDTQVRYLCDQIPESLGDPQKIAGIAADSMRELGDGGMVIDGRVMQQIRDLVGDIEDQQDLVTYIETGIGMEDGTLVAKWKPDPTYVPVLQEIAEGQGLSVSQCVQNLMDWGISQGWGYSINPDTVVAYFTKEDCAFLRQVFDKEHVTGSDIAQFLRQIAQGTESVEAEMTK